ncbi:S-layer family protein [Paenibacillus taihuensis]|uniref:S-layer family protein n=1 Tax=Paenibacillus taihuensis TaxID=1156355 RepID=A0A3D9R1N8_9BACL|nr:S-layer homology domain-containing protein [Paenibacillus taihuensis]REE68736.1 S-layer family protein [Paenibacillus taihuensis]
MRKRVVRKCIYMICGFAIMLSSLGVTGLPSVNAAWVYTPVVSETTRNTGSEIKKMIMDDGRGYLYATAYDTNELLFIDPNTMKIEKRLAVGSHPNGMDQVDNKLYVALEGATLIAVVNLDTKLVESTLITQVQPAKVALDGSSLFYADGDQWCEIHKMDMSTGTDTIIERNIYEPELAVDRLSHRLYAGETSISAYKLNAYQSTTGEKLWSYQPEGDGYATSLVVDTGAVYYGDLRVDPVKPRILSTSSGEVLDADSAFIYTTSGVFTKNEGATAATYSTLYSHSLIQADSGRNIFRYEPYSKTIKKLVYHLNPAQKAIEFQRSADGVSMSFNHGLASWVLGNNDKYLYAISSEANRLLQIDTASFTVTGDRYIGSQPSDVDIKNGVLYISLKGSTHLARIDTENETNFMAPLTELEVGQVTSDIAAGTGKAYYVAGQGWNNVNVWPSESVQLKGSISFSNPSVSLSPDASKLWLGETGSTGSRLFQFNALNGEPLQQLKDGSSNEGNNVLLDGDQVYYGSRRFASSNIGLIYGTYADHLIFASGAKVIGTHAIYDRDTFNPLYKLPFSASLGHIKQDGTILLFSEEIKPYEEDTYTLYKFDNFASMKLAIQNRLRPQGIRFVDQSAAPQFIDGQLTFKPAAMGNEIAHYELSYYDADDKPVTVSNDLKLGIIYEKLPNGNYSQRITSRGILPTSIKQIGIIPIGTNGVRFDDAIALIPLNDNRTAKHSFADVRDEYFARFEIETLASKHMIQGYKDGTFKPLGSVTRAEFATILVNALQLQNPANKEVRFKDVSKNTWYFDAIASCMRAGLIKGYTDGTFRPNQTITQQETLEIINHALLYGGYKETESATLLHFNLPRGYDAWSEQSVDHLLREGIIKENDEFPINADKKSTRSECAELVYRLLYVLGKV